MIESQPFNVEGWMARQAGLAQAVEFLGENVGMAYWRADKSTGHQVIQGVLEVANAFTLFIQGASPVAAALGGAEFEEVEEAAPVASPLGTASDVMVGVLVNAYHGLTKEEQLAVLERLDLVALPLENLGASAVFSIYANLSDADKYEFQRLAGWTRPDLGRKADEESPFTRLEEARRAFDALDASGKLAFIAEVVD